MEAFSCDGWPQYALDPYDEGDGLDEDTKCDLEPLGMNAVDDDEPTQRIIVIIADPPGTVYSRHECTIVFAAPPIPRGAVRSGGFR
jgi:hypothetical protein